MKKWIGYMVLGLMIAGTFFGQESVAETTGSAADGQSAKQRKPKNPNQHKTHQKSHKLSPEQQENRQAIIKLGDAARVETDPVKKEELVGQLRVKLNDMFNNMHAMHQKRLEKATKELEQLKQRMTEAEQNREQRIDEQVQRILSGESFRKPEGPGGKGARPEGGASKKRQGAASE